MCKQVILAQSNTAIVSSSLECDCIHLTLPNITIKLGRESLVEFDDYISTLIERNHITNNKFFVETPYQGIILYFDPQEMYTLNKVLRRSILRMNLNQLQFDTYPSDS